MSEFEKQHAEWLEGHRKRRTGERRSRLERGHAHGERLFLERVWWPLIGHLEGLHPEYEVADWRGRPSFIDLVWIRGQYKFAFEIKGYGPHVQNTDRTRYRQELNRETFLTILGFRVIAIPYDDLAEQPEQTIMLIKMLLAPFLAASHSSDDQYTRLERAVLLIASRCDKPLRPVDLLEVLRIGRRTAVATLQSLCSKGRFRALPSRNGKRVCRYAFVPSPTDHFNLL